MSRVKQNNVSTYALRKSEPISAPIKAFELSLEDKELLVKNIVTGATRRINLSVIRRNPEFLKNYSPKDSRVEPTEL